MTLPSIFDTYKRYRTLQTHRVTSLPVAILMPHSACNCRCVMCDIWKGNHRLQQLTEADISGLLQTFKKLGTRQVVMSGGEALLNPHFFRFCELLKQLKIKISLLSAGLVIKKHAAELVKWTDDIIVSLDGDEALHDQIRNIPGAFRKLKEGIDAIRCIDPDFRVTARSVIHRLNFRRWADIVQAAHALGLNRISFLPADVSSHAFNREMLWNDSRQHELLIPEEDLDALQQVMDELIMRFLSLFKSGFIAESPLKLQKIYHYYAAYYDHCEFPDKRCNAPWVSTVIEADGTVRPCFFHEAHGNINGNALHDIINSDDAVAFRKNLDMDSNETCKKCVCYLNLQPAQAL